MPAGLLPKWALGPLSLSCLSNLYLALLLMLWEEMCAGVWAGVILWLFPSLPHYLLVCVFIVVIKLKMLESSVMSSNQDF